MNLSESFTSEALINSIKKNNINSFNKILKSGSVDINSIDTRTGWSAILWASLKGHLYITKKLINANVDVNKVHMNNRYTALMFSTILSKTKVIQTLLKAGADTNLRDYKDHSALMFAIKYKNIKVVKLLTSVILFVPFIKQSRYKMDYKLPYDIIRESRIYF
jgi:ankyrin repeat protein